MLAVFQTAQDFCQALLSRGDLASKLMSPRTPDGKLLPVDHAADLSEGDTAAPHGGAHAGPHSTGTIDLPARDAELTMRPPGAPEDGKLPTLGSLHGRDARIACLRRFAHHELQAIELFAWALLAFPALPVPLRRGFLLVLEEEQLHLRLYLDRLAAHGAGMTATDGGGLSDYLWRHVAAIRAAADPLLAFLSAVGLTFEQANLDFAGLYRDAFHAAGDPESAAVLDRVHRDEIRHVRLAIRWLHRLKHPGESDLAAYLRTVPFPLSPARAKGRRFDLAARRQAGLSDDFIAHVAAAGPYDRAPADASAQPAKSGTPRLWLFPNLGGEEEDRPPPTAARGFLRGLHGAWGSLFPPAMAAWMLPPGDSDALHAWQQALSAPDCDPPDNADDDPMAMLRRVAGNSEGQLLAWINTPGAARMAAEHRLPLAGPAPDVVARVHDKGFAQTQAAALGLVPACLRRGDDVHIAVLSAELCRDPVAATATVQRQVATWPGFLGSEYVLKPRHGTSGRGRFHGHRDLQSGAPLEPIPDDKWADFARRGGAILEPWLTRTCDLSVQLAIWDDGVHVLGTTTQVLTRSGFIRGNRGTLRWQPGPRGERATPLLESGADAAVEAALLDGAQRLGRAAAAAGYFGIAGIDAFLFRGPDGVPILRPIVELNARFTTGTVAVALAQRAARSSQFHAHGPVGAWALILKAPQPAPPLPPHVQAICPLPRGPVLYLAPSAGDLDPLCAA